MFGCSIKFVPFVLALVISGFTSEYSPTDSASFYLILNDVQKHTAALKSFSAVLKTTTEMAALKNLKIPKDTVVTRFWSVFPGKSRSETKTKQMSLTLITNNGKSCIIDEKAKTMTVTDTSQNKSSSVMVNAKSLLDHFSGIPKVTTLSGDTTMLLKGKFSYNQNESEAEVFYDKKKCHVNKIIMHHSSGTASFDVQYKLVAGNEIINKMTISSGEGERSVKVGILFDSIKVNEKLNDSLFVVPER